eukprot:gnl/TRDRNA2_/TRDRNA2_177362_c0_seq1.p1 gnl/TRDRNA2_/TRDRNA2_177362_c0~~gnl/TRDRNA2_/TRDRNA2_177362_c0_seq1.p1  ORF type:complete len:636 (+),score=300.45 gnl/TRDRNA2_/TRDRNA2_177362_c0_seq1:74-1909(+)
MKDSEEEQEKQTMIRQKENGAYAALMAEMKQALGSLEKAMLMLEPVELMQTGHAKKAAQLVHAVIAAVPASANAPQVPLSQLSILKAFTQKMEAADAATHKAGYEPAANTIVNILKEMDKTFKEDYDSKKEAEEKAQGAYEDFMGTKKEEMLTMQESVKKKEGKKSEAETYLAEATVTYDDTEAQMKADKELFDEVKEGCEEKADEWKERSELRTEELAGIKKAIEILTSDEARALFAKSIKAGIGTGTFLQVSSFSSMNEPINKAYKIVKSAASKAHSVKLAKLAAMIKESKDSSFEKFDDIKKSIDDQIENIKKEGKDDVEKRDECKEELHEIASKSADLKWKIDKNDAKIEKLEGLIAKREEEKADTIAQIEDVEYNIKSMEEQRKAENEAFKENKKDDENAIDLLKDAKEALSEFYDKNDVSLKLVQKKAHEPEFEREEGDGPDASFSDKGKQAGQAKGILALMDYILEDLENEITDGIKNEKAAKEEFEKMMKEAKDLKSDLEDTKTTLEETISKREEEKGDEEEDKETNEGDLDDEMTYRKEIKPDCDFILEAFSDRAKAREAEIAGLTEVKELLSGAAVELLQQPKPQSHKFDDEAFARWALRR